MSAAPPVKRIQTMDVLRGIAVLGILFANISAFGEPMMITQLPFELRGLSIDGQWAETVREVLISGKMRSLLAILFGVGLWMQFSKRKVLEDFDLQSMFSFIGPHPRPLMPPKKRWPGTYLKRTLFLLLLGFLHGLFIWYGDILFTYALCALLAIVFVRLSEKAIFWISMGCIGFGIVIGLVLSASMAAGSSAESVKFYTEVPVIGLNAEINAYTNGSYLAQLLHRAGVLILSGFSLILILPPIFGLFMLGVLFGKRGVFNGGANAEQDIKRMIAIGLGFGIPLNLLPILMQVIGHPGKISEAVEMGFAPILAVGLLGLCLKIVPKIPAVVTDPFRRVGTVALSCYILQSLLATTLFYSWGFRLFDKLEWQGQLAAVFGILLICLLAANIWTRLFSIGPVEWAWRSLSEGKRLPWREPSTAAVSPAA